MFCIVKPGKFAYYEQRTALPRSQAPGLLYKATMGWLPALIVRTKYGAFLKVGLIPGTLGCRLLFRACCVQ